MHPKSPKLLDDTRKACVYIKEDTVGLSLDDYLGSRRTRQLVERNLSIIGEALSRLERADVETASRISSLRQIVGLRNRLAHGYDEEIDHRVIWTTIRQYIPILHAEVLAVLPEFEE